MALLARLSRLALGLVAWFLFVLSPLLRTALTDDWVDLLAGGDGFRARLMEIFFVGSSDSAHRARDVGLLGVSWRGPCSAVAGLGGSGPRS